MVYGYHISNIYIKQKWDPKSNTRLKVFFLIQLAAHCPPTSNLPTTQSQNWVTKASCWALGPARTARQRRPERDAFADCMISFSSFSFFLSTFSFDSGSGSGSISASASVSASASAFPVWRPSFRSRARARSRSPSASGTDTGRCASTIRPAASRRMTKPAQKSQGQGPASQ